MPIIQTTTWMRIKDKTAIVAGGSRGLDKEMTKALAEAGADMARAHSFTQRIECAQQTIEN